MSGFDAAWLDLRAAADARARARALEAALALALRRAGDREHARDAEPLRAVDLACGTGANLRRLAPRLPGAQRWRLVDADALLLRIARERCAGLAGADGATVGVSCELADLAGPALEDACAGAQLVTASALLDLVGAAWLDRLADACAAAGAIALFALDYDGRRHCTPGDPDDAPAHAAFDLHQRRDKGLGCALGPEAAAAAARAFEARGYRVERVRSDWRLDARDAPLQAALLRGWAQAAVEAVPAESARWDGWLARRLARVADGSSVIEVGHEDLLAVPRLADADVGRVAGDGNGAGGAA